MDSRGWVAISSTIIITIVIILWRLRQRVTVVPLCGLCADDLYSNPSGVCPTCGSQCRKPNIAPPNSMLPVSEVTIITEINVGYKVPTLSVYVVWGEYDLDDPWADCDDHTIIDNARKLIGPIDAKTAIRVRDAADAIFKGIGLCVTQVETADD